MTPPPGPLPIDCPQPIDTATLMDYWLGALESAKEEPIEEHLMGREMVTTFTVRQEGGGARTRIETRWQPARGLAGLIERLFAPRMLQQIYREELANLNDVAGSLGVVETGTVAA